jgi:hypothetical protein
MTSSKLGIGPYPEWRQFSTLVVSKADAYDDTEKRVETVEVPTIRE